MVLPEGGIDRFIDKKDEETPLPILPSGILGITVTEDDISMLYCEGISVDDDKDPAPDNVMQSDDVLPNPS